MEEQLTLANFCQLVAAGAPLLYLSTPNEGRTAALVHRAATGVIKGLGEPLSWSCSGGFAGHPGTDEPEAALRWAIGQGPRGIFVFRDFHWFWQDNPFIQRLLLDFAASRKQPGKTLVFLGREPRIPAELQDQFLLLDHGLPDRAEILAWLEASRGKELGHDAILAEPEALARLTLAAQGLDLPDLERALRLARVTRGAGLETVVAALYRDKKQKLRKTGIMEFVDNDVRPEQVGGMDNLKDWMAKREKAFGAAALAEGKNLPKGVLMMGVSGCGKSLFVKAIAARWKLPLVRLDMATVYSGAFGSPETSLRRATRTAEALAPCVLWIDEIEAGISSQGFKAEGGAASRVLGYFLTWMQEKRRPVFVAATANAIEMLPAEVLRKGRFDEIFYVALPEVAEREAIFRIHLQKRNFDPGSFNPAMLAHSAKGFSGAEIEQAVASACFEATAQGREMTQQDILEAISRTVPLSVTMAEQLKKIEAWAFKRAVPAGRAGAK
ncbi:ATPase AAA [Desulfuromonas versatilis]|uniref:Uncharacterized AAA domain-containing protein ycf46 n=1 Tax=Desulfuromonas versatilis TaxID=2802975 RepID=A0ABN6DV75_9BACT|nr:AAA family ATPase [Desulfuromonas versatilis]BCR04021.1 ATPase AAA [Desulfuromonas versatilis]